MYFEAAGLTFYKYLVPLAQKQLETCDIFLDPPSMIAGDASASMQVAIRTATIISSLLAAVGKGELRLFNFRPIPTLTQPRTIQDVINVSTLLQAHGATAPAAALVPLYDHKKEMKFLIYVTDEEENCPYREKSFIHVFEEYRREVAPKVKLVIVSFTENNVIGDMTKAVKEKLNIDPIRFRLNKKNTRSNQIR